MRNKTKKRELNVEEFADLEVERWIVEAALVSGHIRLINEPNMGDIAAQIGEHWFYFAGMDGENISVDEYIETHDHKDIAVEITTVINDFKGDSVEDSTEFLYYYYYLDEILPRIPCSALASTTDGKSYLYGCRCRTCQKFRRCNVY